MHTHPEAAAVRLRCFAEALAGVLYRELRLPVASSGSLFEQLNAEAFRANVDADIVAKLHAIRMLGNKAAHGASLAAGQALGLLKEAYHLARWLLGTCGTSESAAAYPDFAAPPHPAKEPPRPVDDMASQLAQATAELTRLKASERAALTELTDLHRILDVQKLEQFREASSRAAAAIDLAPEQTRRLVSLQDVFASASLTDGQTSLVDRLGQFLDDREHSVFLLKGYAGTGKTFITKGLTEYFRTIGRNYVLAAPTGKASKVIARKTRSPAHTVHKTIYSFKDIREYREEELDGSETFKCYAELNVNELSADTVFIVDEASMLADVYHEHEFFRFGSGFLLRDWLKYVNLDHNDHFKKIIFIGDDAQLPPVGMNFSPALDKDYLLREYGVRATGHELTEVVRQKAGSGVMRNSMTLRDSLRTGVFNQLDVDLSHDDVHNMGLADWIPAYLKSCGNRINGESIIIAGSNSDVAAFNRSVREHFFPGSAEVTRGDKVMAVTNRHAQGFFISNGDFGLVRRVLGDAERRAVTLKRRNPQTRKVEAIDVALNFRDVEVGFRDLDDQAHFFVAKIIEDLLYSDQPALDSDQNKALYVDFCMRHSHLRRGTQQYRDALRADPYFNALRLKFGYAVPCHKAQGSEWNHVFVKCRTHQSQLSADYFRWFYTAITRTASHLYLLDPPRLKLGGGIKMVKMPGMLSAAPAEPSMPLAPPAEVINAVDAVTNTLGILPSQTFLHAILSRVKSLLAGHEVDLEDIRHNQYQEAYFFRRGNETARINIGYDGKERITALQGLPVGEFSGWLQALLAPLKIGMVVIEATAPPEAIVFDKPFLQAFHQRLTGLAAAQHMQIARVKALPWCQRYTFARGVEQAVYDIWYNSKDRFASCQPVLHSCTPGSLVAEVERLLTEGMN
ncbi:RecD-like DNA helicase [Caballeronia sordidicola]|uniref:RecD-like DNA helicase n=1 Tax=Caballeronia sordidicola TaxID=196367 RepID=A0A226WQP8_CABSO|nr:RecD-like DNA helicase [Caballeronia sordidicola]